MIFELYIFAVIIILYGLFITLAIYGFNKHQHIDVKSTLDTYLSISIVLSARNEEKNIGACIKQLMAQEYPKTSFEIILIDDASEDETYKLASNILSQSNIKHQIIRQNEHTGKKLNLTKAIQLATGDIIVTTDADVIYRSVYWLKSIHLYFAKYQPTMLIMPIDYITHHHVLSTFQIVENLAISGITAGYTGINMAFMCNGANLAFKKQAFINANGYQSHLNISSGEDVFLLEDFKNKKSINIMYGFDRHLIVKTLPEINFRNFLEQRIRWAYKAKYNKNQLNLFGGFIIITANLLVLALIVAIIKQSAIIPYLSIFVATKLVFDFLLLFLASNFLNKVKYLVWLIPFECVYWIYALVIGVASLVYKPYWKGIKTR